MSDTEVNKDQVFCRAHNICGDNQCPNQTSDTNVKRTGDIWCWDKQGARQILCRFVQDQIADVN